MKSAPQMLPIPLSCLLLLPSLLLLTQPTTAAEAAVRSAGTPVYPVMCDPATQGCVRYPPGCRSVHWAVTGGGSGGGSGSCEFLAAWRRFDDSLEIAVGGRVGIDGGYVGLGFHRRGGDEPGVLLACYKAASTDDKRVHLRLVSLSRGRQHGGEMPFLQASEVDDARLMTEADGAPLFGADRPERAGYFAPLPAQGFATLECRARLTLRSIGGHHLLEPLLDPKSSLHPLALLHTGRHPVSPGGDGLAKPHWRYKAPARRLDESGEIQGPASTGGAKAHGCLMVIAWVFCASVGTLLARYYKLQWPSRRLGNELVWFQLHRGLLAACCILTLLSFIVIFVDVSGYSGLSDLPDIVHPVLGIIVAILTLANPLISLCRCQPGHKNRPWFNWIHWLVGTIAYILAIFNLFLGLRLERAGALKSIDYHIWILIFFVLLQFVVEIILEVHTLYHWRRNKRRWQRYQEDVLEYQRQRDGTLQKPLSRPVEPKPAGYCLRNFLLALHAVVAAAVALILLIVIIVY